MALLAGLRHCEVLSLERRDIDWARSAIRIRAAASKTGRERLVPLSPSLVEILRRRGAVVGLRVCLNKLGLLWNPERLSRRARYFLLEGGFGRLDSTSFGTRS